MVLCKVLFLFSSLCFSLTYNFCSTLHPTLDRTGIWTTVHVSPSQRGSEAAALDGWVQYQPHVLPRVEDLAKRRGRDVYLN